MVRLNQIINIDERELNSIENIWNEINSKFDTAENLLVDKKMARRELSFHDHIKLLAFLTSSINHIDGDIVEIGVWKGKSLALIRQCSSSNCRIVGIDPCELDGQKEELNYFRSNIFPTCELILNYSHLAIPDLLKITNSIKLLHIDGGHLRMHVWLDFLIYSKFIIPGGYIVFDDYNDLQYSPEVKIAVDEMQSLGVFSDFDIIGVIEEYQNSFILKKK